MPQKIVELIISADGESATLEGEGMTGKECVLKTQKLRSKLGKEKTFEYLREYYDPKDSQREVVQEPRR